MRIARRLDPETSGSLTKEAMSQEKSPRYMEEASEKPTAPKARELAES